MSANQDTAGDVIYRYVTGPGEKLEIKKEKNGVGVAAGDLCRIPACWSCLDCGDKTPSPLRGYWPLTGGELWFFAWRYWPLRGGELGFFVSFDFSGDAMGEIGAYFKRAGKSIVALTVREILDEQIAHKPA